MSDKYRVDIEVDHAEVVDALAECEREAGARKAIYARWVAAGKMTQSLAAERQHRMEAAARLLKRVATSMTLPYQRKLELFKEDAAESGH